MSLAPITGAAAGATPTNFIIINLDDVGLGDFGYNGARGYSTPHIDQMANSGVRLTNFYVAQAISGASRAGLLTGCYPNRIGFWGAPGPNAPYGVAQSEMNIAEVLKSANYSTAAFGKWHLGDNPQFMPLQNGFDEYYGLPYSNDMWPNHPQNSKFGFTDLPLIEGNDTLGFNTDQTRLTTDYTLRAVDFIERNKKSPFFLYLAHSMPHVPLAVSDKFKGKSELGLWGDVMMELDWSVGQVLSTLERLKLDRNTMVILVSDNGPWINYGNHAGSTGGLREGKATTFEGGNRVPCVIYWKGVTPEGASSNKLASTIDFLPTIASIAGVSLPELPIDGVNIRPIIEGELDATPRTGFAYYFNKNDLEAVTDGRYKLVFPHKHASYAKAPGNDGAPGEVIMANFDTLALFDLVRDAGERYNVISQHPDVVAKLTKYADSMREELGDNLTGKIGRANRPVGMVEPLK